MISTCRKAFTNFNSSLPRNFSVVEVIPISFRILIIFSRDSFLSCVLDIPSSFFVPSTTSECNRSSPPVQVQIYRVNHMSTKSSSNNASWSYQSKYNTVEWIKYIKVKHNSMTKKAKSEYDTGKKTTNLQASCTQQIAKTPKVQSFNSQSLGGIFQTNAWYSIKRQSIN